MKNQKAVNELMNSLITSFKQYNKSLKNRIKVNSIFSGFDENMNKNFSKLINLSDLRYKSVKSGVKLNNIVTYQKPKYENLIEEIKNDKLYSTNILDTEKEKLLKSSLVYRNKEIHDIRNKLKTSLKPKLYIYKSQNKNSSHEKKLKLKNMIRRVNNIIHINAFLKKRIKNKKSNTEKEKFIDNLMEKDYKKFQDNIETYHEFLNNLRTISENNNSKKKLKIDKTVIKKTIDNISPKSFQALTYIDDSSKKKPVIKKEDFQFDLRKIKNIKMYHDKNINTILKNQNSKYCKTENDQSKTSYMSLRDKSLTPNNLTNYNISYTLNTNINSDRKRKNKDKSLYNTKPLDFKNTAYLILNETENRLYNEENYKNKKNKIDNYFKLFKTHSNINNDKAKSFKRKSIQEIKIKEETNDNNNIKTNTIEIKDYNEKNSEKIRKKFQEIYEEKRLKWKKEDKLKELKKEKERQNRIDIENFLFEVSNKKYIQRNKS